MLNRVAGTRTILALMACCLGALSSSAQIKDSAPDSGVASYRISGTVVSKTDGYPLNRTRVSLRDVKARGEPQSVVTAEDGKFAFENVKAGKYTLQGVRSGFIPTAYDQHDQYSSAIVTGAGVDTENLVLRISPEALVSGHVLDEAGEPVRHAQVTLYRNNRFEGIEHIQAIRNAQTDDLGAFELTPPLPGTYYLAVHAQPWYAIHPLSAENRGGSSGEADEKKNLDRSLDAAYPVTYYENATETDSATPIQIRGGEHLQVEMNLSPVPALRLIFHIPAGQSNETIPPQLEQAGFDGSTSVSTVVQVPSPGVVEVSGVPAGRYNVRIGQNTITQLNGIELNKDGEEIDASAAEALGTVKVSLKLLGQDSVPPGLGVGLFQESKSVGGLNRPGAKGEIEIQQVPAGTYSVQTLGGGKTYGVVSISAEGAQVKGHTITMPPGASATIALSVAAGVDVQGVAKKAGKPFTAAMIVLVPKNPEDNRDLFRRDQSDLDGTFSLVGVVPGSYTIIAIDDGWDLDWSQPEVIAPYLKRGMPIEVRSATSSPVQLKEAIEVQSK